MPTILLIARPITHDDSFVSHLEKRYTVITAQSGKQGIALGNQKKVAAVVLDAASLRTTGERVCRALRSALLGVPLVHIHPGPREEGQSDADVLLFAPVAPRRLMNSLARLLEDEQEEILEVGPFSMNVPRRILIAHGQEQHLTPKQAALVSLFLRHPGTTIDRKTIMNEVWETDYLGDTRTLNVHIRWLRQIMENGSDKPRYLVTVRGVGYCLQMGVGELIP
ncbi:MAG: response regulator transcription factor [Anaerolineae bacterium]